MVLKGEGTPKVTEATIINPTHTDLLALKRTGSTSKWSDHSAVEITTRYTNTPKQKRDWVYPKHILTGNLEEVKYLRKEVETLLSTTQHGKAGAALKTWLNKVKERTIEKEKENKINHLAKKHSTIAKLKGIYNLIGDGMGKEGSLKEPVNVREIKKWDLLEANKKEIEEDLAEITRKEQQLWLDNRGYEECTFGERCSRKSFEFDGMRTFIWHLAI